jgi:hypothetical protein
MSDGGAAAAPAATGISKTPGEFLKVLCHQISTEISSQARHQNLRLLVAGDQRKASACEA